MKRDHVEWTIVRSTVGINSILICNICKALSYLAVVDNFLHFSILPLCYLVLREVLGKGVSQSLHWHYRVLAYKVPASICLLTRRHLHSIQPFKVWRMPASHKTCI